MNRMRDAYIVLAAGTLLLTALALHGAQQYDLKNLVLIMSTAVAGTPIPFKAYKALRMKTLSIELLITIAVVGALIIGEYVESAVVTFLFVFGAWLQARTLEKTRSAMQKLIASEPLRATVIRADGNVSIAVENIAIGDRIAIHRGEKVTVDGPIVLGLALIDESAITGVTESVRKSVNNVVYSGTFLESGYVEVIARCTSADTTSSKMIAMLEDAQETGTKTHWFLERFATAYTPSVVALSLLVYVFTGDIHMALTFLVIACPGALVIAGPVSLAAGLGNGARHGILIKDGETVENLAKVDVVLFTKAGILTTDSQGPAEARTDTQIAIDQVRSAGISKLYLLTEDSVETGRAMARAYGLDGVYAELSPERKVEQVTELIAQGHKVAIIGDGVHDAPALAAANVGVALGAANSIVSMGTADVVLLSNRLGQFSYAYLLARSTLRNMKQNTYFAMATVVLLLFGVLLGSVFLASGMLIHELSVLIVILNAVRLTCYRNPHHPDLAMIYASRKKAAQATQDI